MDARRDAAAQDAASVRRILAGDPSAYGEVVRRHERGLRRLVTGIVGDVHLAEDVVQEAFLLAYRRLAGFRGEATFRTWITRIAIREAVRSRTRWRRLWRRLVPLEAARGRESKREAAAAAAARDLEGVLALLERIPARERAALLLHAVEGRSYSEIASILEAPIGTVGSLISRARVRLRGLEAGEER